MKNAIFRVKIDRDRGGIERQVLIPSSHQIKQFFQFTKKKIFNLMMINLSREHEIKLKKKKNRIRELP